MSALEQRAKPILRGIIAGEPVELDAAAQTIVSSWATKTAIIVEPTLGASSDKLYYTQEERSKFRVSPHAPPIETTVAIGVFGGPGFAYARGGAHRLMSIGGELFGPATTATLAVGKLVLQVHSNRHQATTGRGFWHWPNVHTNKTHVIWPVIRGRVRWPTGEPLNDQELRVFAGEQVPEEGL